MITIKNRLDFIEKENQKTVTLSSFKQKKNTDKKTKDLKCIIEKSVNIKNQIQEQNNILGIKDNIQDKEKSLNVLIQKKRKPVIWL